jgi:hypothetical protein
MKVTTILGIGLVGAGALLPIKNARADDFLEIGFDGGNRLPQGAVNLWHSGSSFNSIYHPPSFPPALEIYSLKSNKQWSVDGRKFDENIFHVILTGDSGGGTNFYAPGNLTFGWIQGPESNRVETARVHLDTGILSNSSAGPYDVSFAIPNGTNTFALPDLVVNSPDTNSYVDISCRFLTNALPTNIDVNGTNASVQAKVQPGATVAPQYRPDLTSGSWSNLTGFSQYVVPDTNNFNATAYDSNAPSMMFSNLPAVGTNGFYRLMQSN